MYICSCNPFTDRDVNAYLDLQRGQKVKAKEVYTACSGAVKMNCGTCACALKTMVDTHNNALTIDALSRDMEKILHKSEEKV